MSKFILEIETSNDAFNGIYGDYNTELLRVFSQVMNKMANPSEINGLDLPNHINDTNGNKIGFFKIID
jgi:hypothetical protein